jgi:hypothetical protein
MVFTSDPDKIAKHGSMKQLEKLAQELPTNESRSLLYETAINFMVIGIAEGTRTTIGSLVGSHDNDNLTAWQTYMQKQADKYRTETR